MIIEPLKTRLVNAVIQEISNHRLGLPANDTYSQTVVHSFVTVEEYKKKQPLKVILRHFKVIFFQIHLSQLITDFLRYILLFRF